MKASQSWEGPESRIARRARSRFRPRPRLAIALAARTGKANSCRPRRCAIVRNRPSGATWRRRCVRESGRGPRAARGRTESQPRDRRARWRREDVERIETSECWIAEDEWSQIQLEQCSRVRQYPLVQEFVLIDPPVAGKQRQGLIMTVTSHSDSIGPSSIDLAIPAARSRPEPTAAST